MPAGARAPRGAADRDGQVALEHRHRRGAGALGSASRESGDAASSPVSSSSSVRGGVDDLVVVAAGRRREAPARRSRPRRTSSAARCSRGAGSAALQSASPARLRLRPAIGRGDREQLQRVAGAAVGGGAARVHLERLRGRRASIRRSPRRAPSRISDLGEHRRAVAVARAAGDRVHEEPQLGAAVHPRRADAAGEIGHRRARLQLCGVLVRRAASRPAPLSTNTWPATSTASSTPPATSRRRRICGETAADGGRAHANSRDAQQERHQVSRDAPHVGTQGTRPPGTLPPRSDPATARSAWPCSQTACPRRRPAVVHAAATRAVTITTAAAESPPEGASTFARRRRSSRDAACGRGPAWRRRREQADRRRVRGRRCRSGTANMVSTTSRLGRRAVAQEPDSSAPRAGRQRDRRRCAAQSPRPAGACSPIGGRGAPRR